MRIGFEPMFVIWTRCTFMERV